jgi:hypothetical protein
VLRAAAVIAVLVLAFWARTTHERSVTEHRLTAMATVLARRSVGVKC